MALAPAPVDNTRTVGAPTRITAGLPPPTAIRTGSDLWITHGTRVPSPGYPIVHSHIWYIIQFLFPVFW